MATKTNKVVFETIAKLDGYKKMEEANKLLTRSLKGTGVNAKDVTKIFEYQARAVQRGSQQFLRFSADFQLANGKTLKVTRDLFPAFDTLVTKTNKNREAFELSKKSINGFGGILNNFGLEFKKVAERAALTVPIWFAVRTALNAIRFAFSESFKSIDSLDTGVRRALAVFSPLERTQDLAERLKNTFYDLAVASGTSIEDVAKSTRELARAGLDAKEAIEATEAAVKLMTVTETSQESATRALVLAHNLFGEAIRDSAKGQNEFNVTAAFFAKVADSTVGSMDELLQGFVTFAPTARSLNLTLEQTTGLLASLGNIGFVGASGGTILNRLFSRSTGDIEGINKLIKDFGGTIASTATPFERIVTLFDTLSRTKASDDTVFKAFVDFFGERGQKGIAFIKDLPQFLQGLKEMENTLKDSSGAVNELNDKMKLVVNSNELLKKEISTSIGGIGTELLQLLTPFKDFNGVLQTINNSLLFTKQILEDINQAGGFVKLLVQSANQLGENVLNVATFGAFRRQQDLNKRNERGRFDPSDPRFEQESFDRLARKNRRGFSNEVTIINPDGTIASADDTVSSATAQSKENLQIQKEALENSFIYNKESEKNLTRLKEEYIQLLKNEGIVNRTAKATSEYNASINLIVDKIKELTNKDVSNSTIESLLGKNPEEIGSFLKSLGLEEDTDRNITPLFETAFKKAIDRQKAINKDINDETRRRKQLQEFEIDNLKLLGYKESELSALKLELYRNEADFKERQHRLNLQRLEEERARTLEIFESIKSVTQSSFEGLLKNEITPQKFLGNIGTTLQDQSIKSSANVLTEAFLGTGFAKDFSEALGGFEQNPIVRSFVDGARRAEPILAGAIAKGASGQTGINTGDPFQSGGLGGAISGLFGGLGGLFGGKQNRIQSEQAARVAARTGASPQGAGGLGGLFGGNAGGLFNAGLAGVFSGVAASQRGGKAAGLLGGAGGFLSSAAPFLGALGPIGMLAGAGLTIASFFGGKKKTVENQYQQQLISISPKIDVTNKKLEVINRNLVALKTVMEAYVLPQSAYYSESRNISDQFSVYARRGLVS